MRIYLGAAPGVGKTFAMLNEGHRRRDGAPTSSSGSSRRTGAPAPPSRSATSRCCPAAPFEHRGSAIERDGRRRHPAAPPRPRARRRVRPHQRPRVAPREALAGRRGAAGRRHRRHLDGQHPAPRVAQRRRRADHRHPPARDGARPCRAGRRPDRARRHGARGAAPAAGPRQRLRAGEDRRRARQLLPRRQPVGAARAGPAVGRRPGRRRARRLPRPARHHAGRGRRASGWSSPSPARRGPITSCAGRPASPSGPRAS